MMGNGCGRADRVPATRESGVFRGSGEAAALLFYLRRLRVTYSHFHTGGDRNPFACFVIVNDVLARP